MAMTPPEPHDDYAARQRTNLMVTAVAVGIVVVTVVLMLWLKRDNELQECLAAHHITCATINEDQGH